MLKIWKNEPLTFPNGVTRDVESLRSTGEYEALLNNVCAIDVSDDGVTEAYYTMRQLRKQYSVDTADDEKALAEIIDKIQAAEEAAKKEAVTIEDLQAQIADQQAALLELGDLIGGE